MPWNYIKENKIIRRLPKNNTVIMFKSLFRLLRFDFLYYSNLKKITIRFIKKLYKSEFCYYIKG